MIRTLGFAALALILAGGGLWAYLSVSKGMQTDVLIVIGESNAAGLTGDVPGAWRSDPDIVTWNGTDWVTYEPNKAAGFNWSFGGDWGAELEYARQFRDRHPDRRLAIFKFTAGGSFLHKSGDAAVWDWNVDSPNELFSQYQIQVQAALDGLARLGDSPRVRLVWWDQGINDAIDQARVSDYSSNLSAFLFALRNQSSGYVLPPEVPIVIGAIKLEFEYATAVREAQEVASRSAEVVLLDRDDLAFTEDYTHFSAQSLVAIGRRLFAMDTTGLQP